MTENQAPSTDESTSSAPPTFASFEEFWPHYVAEHLSPASRWLHFAGTTAAMVTAGAAILTRKKSLLLLAVALGYGPAWASHFFIEHNHPATFRHPIWSFRADLVMWKKMVDGSMSAEVAAVIKAREEAAKAASAASASGASTASETRPVTRVRVGGDEETRHGAGSPPVANGVSS